MARILRHWGRNCWGISSAIAVVLALAAAFWWYALDARAPASAEGVFDLEAWRAMTADDEGRLPTEIRLEMVGGDVAPGWAAEAGKFGAPFVVAYTSVQIIGPDTDLILGGAVDKAGVAALSQGSESWFDAAAYARMTGAMTQADIVTVTHEHADHVLGIVRHPHPAAIAPKLRLTRRQLDGMARFGPGGALPDAFNIVRPWTIAGPVRLAPGVIAAPAEGHSPGTLVFYVRTQTGPEFLFIGDIVWTMSNIETLKTRPRFLQFLMFEPNEERDIVLRQVRALRDMRDGNPELILVPSHDRPYLEGLIERGVLKTGFDLRTPGPVG